MAKPFVLTEALTKRYGSLTALVDCSLDVQAGEVYGLLGPNGSGKTTLIRLLLGFLQPTSGHAWIDGLDCYHDSVAVHERTAYLPGDARLFPQMRGTDVLRFFAQVRPGTDYHRAVAMAERLKLDLSRQVANCSTGMRQKLALAAVLASDCALVILDEPTANLDPSVRSEVLLLVAEAKAAGRTVIFSSHVLSETEQVCDRVAILRFGQLVHTQVISQLRRQHRIRARLTGALPPPPENLAEGLHVETGPGGRLTIETPGELRPLLGWLATLPMDEVQIEPVGLQAIYDRYHNFAAESVA
ncbi:MAG: ABC transporter ATP-binding protein [Pirellulales bacterium]|nr:ABC transporter ATP-binding protein [Pirellulales bacterium]